MKNISILLCAKTAYQNHGCMKFFWTAVLKTTIPTALIYIGRSEEFFVYLKNHNVLFSTDSNTDNIKLTCFLIGLLWAGLVIPIQYERLKAKYDNQNNQFIKLLGKVKDVHIEAICKHLGVNTKLKTRVFVKKRNYHNLLKKKKNREVFFGLKHVDGISDEINSDKLKFRVAPNPQGIIGLSYRDRKRIIDSNVRPDNYNLSHFQKSQTEDVKFCCVAPVYDEESNIVAFVSLDSNERIEASNDDAASWNKLINEYCYTLDKHINKH